MSSLNSTKFELRLSASDLISADKGSLTDGFAVVSLKDQVTGKFTEVGRTTRVKDSLNPSWADRVVLEYCFEARVDLRITVYDQDGESQDLSKHQFLGYCDISLGAVISSPGCAMQRPLRDKNDKVTDQWLVARVEEIVESRSVVSFRISCRDLEKMDTFGKSDAYVTISRITEDGKTIEVFRSETIMKNLNPSYAAQTVSASKLCNGDLKRKMLVQVYDWDKNSADDLIGQTETTFADLVEAKSSTFTLLRPTSKKNPTKPRGEITFADVGITHDYNYIDYIQGGCAVRLMVAIDFTGSNGDPRDSRSLHYRAAGVQNQYQQVIQSIGGIVLDYDTDKQCPVWGFGGKVEGRVNHCFSLAPPNQDEVVGIEGLLEAYNKAFDYVLLSGPTNFSEVIQTAGLLSMSPAHTPTSQHYSILMIITDGVISDFKETVDSIVQASSNPLSIIIIGVGDADFSDMQRLDADRGGLRSSSGINAKRDIVQFVRFKEFSGGHISRLAKATLKEIPKQMTGYFNSVGVPPMQQRQFDPERKMA